MSSETEAILHAHLSDAEEDRDRLSRALDVTSQELLVVSLERNAIRETLRALGERLDWIERDRREPDKVLCALQSARRELERAAAPRKEQT